MDWESCQQGPNTRIETVNTEKQEYSNRIETQININRNTTCPNTEQQQHKKKNKYRDCTENDIWKENLITISPELTLENSLGGKN